MSKAELWWNWAVAFTIGVCAGIVVTFTLIGGSCD